MPTVFIPPLLKPYADGAAQVEVVGETVGQVLDALEGKHPALKGRLREGHSLKPGLAVAVDGRLSNRGLVQPVGPDSEVHFLPAVGGG